MAKKKINHKDMKRLVSKVVADCKKLADEYVNNWKPVNKDWTTIEGAVYLRLSDNSQVAVERGSLEQQIHIAISEAQYRSEQEKMNYRITEFYIEPGVTGTHDNRPEFIRLQQKIRLQAHKFIIFKEISRLVRDLEIWKRFFRLCQDYDCEICLRGLPFNPNDPASILQLDQLAAYAEFESRTTSKRIKESNHSALLTSGKFNGDFPLLGFDIIKNVDGDNTGIYKPNQEELKQVKWIMEAFLRTDKYGTLLKWCKERNIKTKQGKDFKRGSLKVLLTNSRYIGKWYRNKHNKDKRQSKLMPYDRYTEITFDHGCVIDKDLWDSVQKKVQAMDDSRAKGVRRCYPLSGLLVHQDGTSFVGNGAWGRTHVSTYYYNASHNMRVRTDIFEREVERVLNQVARDSKEVQESLSNYLQQKDSLLKFLKDQTQQINARRSELDVERTQLDKRLNFLLADEDPKMALSFKDEYKKQYLGFKQEESDLANKQKHLEQLRNQLILDYGPCDDQMRQSVVKALKHIQNKDLISLKAAYRSLFQNIIIQPLDSSRVQLKFVFKDASSALGRVEDFFCILVRMVDLTGYSTNRPITLI